MFGKNGAMVSRLALMSSMVLAATGIAAAEGKYDPGASDTEIKIGNTMPYSGPASAYGYIGKIHEAYFKKINDEGGINGRKITFISYDDAYSPAKTIEAARKLVEDDGVLLMFNPLGEPTNVAITPYMNQMKVPQLFVSSGSRRFDNPKETPWTMGWQATYYSEGVIYGKWLDKEQPAAKIAVIYQDDDLGKDTLSGLKAGLGAGAEIVYEASYELSDPTIDSQVVAAKASGANVFVSLTTPKFAAQSIRKVAELSWKPLFILSNVSSGVGTTIQPAGLDISQGIISARFTKDYEDPQWKGDKCISGYDSFIDKYYPDTANRVDGLFAYSLAQSMEVVLRQAGDDLTRANLMKTAASLKDVQLDCLLPGVVLNTSETDFAPVEQLQMIRFKGDRWEYFGDIINASDDK